MYVGRSLFRYLCGSLCSYVFSYAVSCFSRPLGLSCFMSSLCVYCLVYVFSCLCVSLVARYVFRCVYVCMYGVLSLCMSDVRDYLFILVVCFMVRYVCIAFISSIRGFLFI